MEDNYNEYITFKVTTSDGNEVEMAVMEEFEFEHHTYVAAAVIEDDTINEDGMYIYRAKLIKDELIAEKITDKDEYAKVVNAYMELE